MKNKNLISISGKKGHGKNTVANIITYLTCTVDNIYHESFNPEIGAYAQSIYTQKSFAETLKKIASIMLGIPREDFEKEESKRKILPPQWDKDKVPMSVRTFLQKLGTEVGRSIHENSWVNTTFASYQLSRNKFQDDDTEEYNLELPKWILTDTRFPNEVKAVKDREGINLRVFSPGVLSVHYKDKLNLDEEDHSGIYSVEAMEAIDGKVFYTLSCEDGVELKGFFEDCITFKSEDNHESERALDTYDFDEIIINDGSFEDLVTQVEAILVKYDII